MILFYLISIWFLIFISDYMEMKYAYYKETDVSYKINDRMLFVNTLGLMSITISIVCLWRIYG